MALPPPIEAALRAGNTREAARLARREIANAPGDPQLFNLAAYDRLQEGALDEALELLEKARALAPHDPFVLNSLGNLYRRRGEAQQAREIFEQICALDPANIAARFNLARLLEDDGDTASAARHYEAILAQAPNDAEALSRLFHLAALKGEYLVAEGFGARASGAAGMEPVFGLLSSLALQRADYQAARHYGEKALALGFTARAVTALANAEFRGGDLPGARQRLEGLLQKNISPDDRAIALSLLGDIKDKQGETGAAFENYRQSKHLLAELYAPQLARPGERTAYALVEELRAYFAEHGVPRAPTPNSPRATEKFAASHVFLVGFPRSGTTVLEQSLAGHKAISTLDEAPILMETLAPLWSTRSNLDAFRTSDNAVLEPFRAAYWQRVHNVVPKLRGKILIDKMPLNCLLLPHIARVFPEAKILFALRDPRDVVLSCFRTRFTMTPYMYELCSPERAARFYDSVMSYCEMCRAALTIPLFQTRYEDMIADYEGRLRAICAFLEIEFEPAMLEPDKRARARTISTPSGAQIARGRFDGSQQWRRYEAELLPILPILAPWIGRFGYPEA